MGGFFDPNPRPEELISMYGSVHLIALLLMLSFIPLMLWQRSRVRALRNNRRFMVGISIAILAGEVFEYSTMWIHHYEPRYELYPFHLCGMLAIALPILVLVKRYDILRFITVWSIAAGCISLLNLGITHNDLHQLTFYHYFWKHYYLFLFPIFLCIADGYTVRYREFLKSMAGLLILSGIMFLANWAFDTNYLYIGPHNEMAVPFVPDSLMVWPIVYPTFIVIGVILFHIIYAALVVPRRLWKAERYRISPDK